MDLVLFTFFCNTAEMKLHLKPFIINNGFEAEILLRSSGAFYITERPVYFVYWLHAILLALWEDMGVHFTEPVHAPPSGENQERHL